MVYTAKNKWLPGIVDQFNTELKIESHTLLFLTHKIKQIDGCLNEEKLVQLEAPPEIDLTKDKVSKPAITLDWICAR